MKLIPSTHDAITGLSAKSIHVIGIVNLGRSANASRGTLNAPATVRLDVNGVVESVCVYLGYAHPKLGFSVANAFPTIRVNMDVADLMGLAGHLNQTIVHCPRVTVRTSVHCPRVTARTTVHYPRVTVQTSVHCPRVTFRISALGTNSSEVQINLSRRTYRRDKFLFF